MADIQTPQLWPPWPSHVDEAVLACSSPDCRVVLKNAFQAWLDLPFAKKVQLLSNPGVQYFQFSKYPSPKFTGAWGGARETDRTELGSFCSSECAELAAKFLNREVRGQNGFQCQRMGFNCSADGGFRIECEGTVRRAYSLWKLVRAFGSEEDHQLCVAQAPFTNKSFSYIPPARSATIVRRMPPNPPGPTLGAKFLGSEFKGKCCTDECVWRAADCLNMIVETDLLGESELTMAIGANAVTFQCSKTTDSLGINNPCSRTVGRAFRAFVNSAESQMSVF